MTNTARQLAASYNPEARSLPAPRPAEQDEADATLYAARVILESLTPGQLTRLADDSRAPTMVPRYAMRSLVQALGPTYLPEDDDE